MKTFIRKLGPILAAIALAVTTISANTACTWVCHQPALPKGAAKLRRF